MNLLSGIKRILGIKGEPPLTDTETELYLRFRRNRDHALQEIIPIDMRDEFVKTVYPDRTLKSLAQGFYLQNRLNSEVIDDFKLNYMMASMSIKGFGAKLLVRNIHPEEVLSVMLRGI